MTYLPPLVYISYKDIILHNHNKTIEIKKSGN